MHLKLASVFILQEMVAVQLMHNIWPLNSPDDFTLTGMPCLLKPFIAILPISRRLPMIIVMMKYMHG